MACLVVWLGLWLAIPPTLRAEHLPVKLFTSADGLGSSAIFHIARDPLRGFLWISSRDGLIRFDGYRFITYNVGGPEVSPSIYHLLATKRGMYWITPNRGTRYRVVPGADTAMVGPAVHPPSQNDSQVALAAEPVTDIPFPQFEDRAGNLWATDGVTLYQIQEVDNRWVSVASRLPGDTERALGSLPFYEGEDGSLWIGTHQGLVRRLPDGRMIHFSIQPNGDGDRVFSIAEDRDGRIWISRREGRERLFVLKPEPLSAFAGVSDSTSRKLIVHTSSVAADGRPRLPERHGEAMAFAPPDILRRDPPRNANEAPLPKPVIFRLLHATDDRVWIQTNRGLVVFDGERLQHYTIEQGLVSNVGNSISEDNAGNIWLGGNAGLVRLNPKGLTTFDRTDGLGDTSVASIYEDHSGELHVITNGWYVSRLHHGAFVTERPHLPDDSTAVWHSNLALLDSRGELWIATQQKLYRYSGFKRVEDLAGKRPTAIYTRRDGLSGDSIYRISEDSRGDLWISTFRGGSGAQRGLTRWQRASGKFHAFTEAEAFPADTSASAFAEDRSGAIWIGLDDEGLARYRDGHFTIFRRRDGIPGGGITDLHLDGSGHLWIASSQSGLSRLEDTDAARPVFKTYTIADGLASNNIRCITEDLSGNIFVGTARGINRLSPANGGVRYYGVADGLAADFVTSAFRDRHGTLWFGTFNGLSRLVPVPDNPPQPPPPVLINSLRIAGVDYAVSPLGQREVSAPELDSNQNNLQIDFASISVGAAGSLRYQYKLEGADKDWSPPTFDRAVAYANLAPGTYRFLVRAVNAGDSISSTPATISFRIIPPIWKRWWFIALVAALVAAATHTIYRYRTRRLLELERVRTRIATDLHDDIGSSLSRVAILSEVVKRQNVNSNRESADRLTEIAETARGLVDTMSDIVWSIDPRRDDLKSVALRVRQFAADVLEAKGIRWEFETPPEFDRVKLTPEQRRHLFLIFKEAINNVARHAGCGSVYLNIAVSDRQVHAEIRDDGHGFQQKADGVAPSQNGRGGRGLGNMRARAAEVGGRFEIFSSPGVGTRVTLTMPLDERHGINMLFPRRRK